MKSPYNSQAKLCTFSRRRDIGYTKFYLYVKEKKLNSLYFK